MGMISTPVLPGTPSYINALSPYFVSITSTQSNWTHAQLSMWIWQGDYNDGSVVNGLPNQIQYKEKVSITDNFILFELSDYITPFLNPTIDFMGSTSTTVSDMCVWVYYEAFIYNNPLNLLDPTVLESQQSELRMGIYSYNWNYENQIGLDYTNTAFGSDLGTPSVADYNYVSGYPNNFYFTNTFKVNGLTNSNDMVNLSFISNPTPTKCSVDPYTILYLNKNGGWSTFNTHGKVVIDNDIKSKEYEHSFRNPLFFDNSKDHSIKKYNIESTQKYQINTGAIKYLMGQMVEEILYSPKIYLIKYNKDMTSFQQIPVVVDSPKFQRKTAINDKNKISYVMTFKETSNKLRNII